MNVNGSSNFPETANKIASFSEAANELFVRASPERDTEVVRLIGQYLCEKGYSNAYAQLVKDSGVSLEPQAVSDLRRTILSGDWENADIAVNDLTAIIQNPTQITEIRFLLLEQQFLELAEADNAMAALILLRTKITPLQRNANRLGVLTRCLMCRTGEEVRAEAGGWSGARGGSRATLVDNIQKVVSAQTMLLPNRLTSLIEEAIRAEVGNCIFHNVQKCSPNNLNSISLLQPHSCSIQDFPVFPAQKIDNRETDLYFCHFSPDGAYLATGGKEANVDVWRVDAVAHRVLSWCVVNTNESPIGHICWSPNSKKLAVCCGEKHSSVIVFDISNVQQICSKRVSERDVYSAASFFADSRKLAFGGMEGTFYVMDTENDGHLLATVEGYRVQSMAAIINHLPPIDFQTGPPEINGDSEACRFTSDPTTPGAPGSNREASHNNLSHLSQSADLPAQCGDNSVPAACLSVDQLLVADNLHRIRLFKFGYTDVSSENNVSAELNDTNPLIEIANVTTQSTVGWIPSSLAVPAGGRGIHSIIELRPSAIADILAGARSMGSQSTPGAPLVIGRSSASTGHLQSSLDSNVGRHRLHPSSSPGSATGLSSDNRSDEARPRSLATTHSGYPVLISGDSSSGGSESIFHITAPAELVSSSTGSGSETTPAIVSSVGVGLPSSIMVPFVLQSYRPRFSFASTTTTTVSADPTADASTLIESANQEESTVPTTAFNSSDTSSDLVNQIVGQGSGTPTGTQTYALLQHNTIIREIHAIQSISLSPSGKRLLVTLHKTGLHLWDLDSRSMIQRFWGFKQGSYKLTPSIGGVNEDFVISGSEDGFLHVWHVSLDNCPIHSALASTGRYPVNCAHWNPTLPTMLATVNDVGELRIWAPAKYADH